MLTIFNQVSKCMILCLSRSYMYHSFWENFCALGKVMRHDYKASKILDFIDSQEGEL